MLTAVGMRDPDGMTMRKVTVSLPEETADGVQALVKAGQAASFSAYVAAAAAASLDRDRALAELREHTGGPQGGEMRARAARLFGDDPTGAAVTDPMPPTAAGDRSGTGRRVRTGRRKAS